MGRRCGKRYRSIVVRLEDLQTAEFLIEYSQRLELLGFLDLLLEPVLHLILLGLFQIGVIVIDVSAAQSAGCGEWCKA